MTSHIPVGLMMPPRALDISNGCQDHTTAPFVLRARSSLTGKLPCDIVAPDAAASTASHPNVRDDREPPLMGDEMATVVNVIWVNREAIYFLKEG
jgi:hypothetical protein